MLECAHRHPIVAAPAAAPGSRRTAPPRREHRREADHHDHAGRHAVRWNATAPPETISFSARTLDGGTFAGGSHAGKPAVVWFWAAWCTRRRAVADKVAVVQRDNAGRVNLAGVGGLGSGDEAMRRFAQDTGIGRFPNLADDDGQVWRRFKVTGQEHYMLLGSAGTVVHSLGVGRRAASRGQPVRLRRCCPHTCRCWC